MGAAGQDLEREQNHTFTVISSDGAASLFSKIPVLHANGTLEFDLLVNRTGLANFSILLTDDGWSQDQAAGTLDYTAAHGIPYTGVNVSEAEVPFSVYVAATYAMIRFNTSNISGYTNRQVVETARRVIAAGEGMSLSRLRVVPLIMSSPASNCSPGDHDSSGCRE